MPALRTCRKKLTPRMREGSTSLVVEQCITWLCPRATNAIRTRYVDGRRIYLPQRSSAMNTAAVRNRRGCVRMSHAFSRQFRRRSRPVTPPRRRANQRRVVLSARRPRDRQGQLNHTTWSPRRPIATRFGVRGTFHANWLSAREPVRPMRN